MARISSRLLGAAAIATLLASGCDSGDERLHRMATEHARQQVEQNRRMADMQKDLTDAAKNLVTADAKSRQEMLGLHRDLQSERSEIGKQRDGLETDRRQIAEQRRVDPIIAIALQDVGLLIASAMPLIVCWYLLRSVPDSEVDQAVSELLMTDMVSPGPLLLTHLRHDVPRLESEVPPDPPRIADEQPPTAQPPPF